MKNRKQWEQPEENHPGIIYKPCKFCGSMDYDFAEAEVDENMVFEPTACDVCGFGLTLATHSLIIQ